MQAYTLRLKPEQNLLDEIERFARDQNIEAGCVLCSVGGRTKAMIRPANREFTSAFAGHFEIVSMTGTVSIHGSYLHISISDGDGKTIGGHLTTGCTVYTTAEIVLAAFGDVV